ncbi:MAG: RNA methyltransferase [Ruminococcaceae bacterium]|nr:RNA methyltransferase [Oscillospiraceae bacterium]
MQKETVKFVNSNLFEGMPSISALIKGIEAQKNDRKILKILFDADKLRTKQGEFNFLQKKSKELDFFIETVSREEIDRITVGNTHGGIVAECTDRNLPMLSEVDILPNGVYFILEGVEDPYNFGYAIRSLYAAGVDGLILGARNWMGAAGVVARSSAGTSELMRLFTCEATEAIDLFHKRGYSVICAGIRDSESLFDTDLKKPLLVILGGEKRGISRNILNLADRIVRIDYGSSFGGSLSTSAAAAVFAFEILRANR